MDLPLSRLTCILPSAALCVALSAHCSCLCLGWRSGWSRSAAKGKSACEHRRRRRGPTVFDRHRLGRIVPVEYVGLKTQRLLAIAATSWVFDLVLGVVLVLGDRSRDRCWDRCWDWYWCLCWCWCWCGISLGFVVVVGGGGGVGVGGGGGVGAGVGVGVGTITGWAYVISNQNPRSTQKPCIPLYLHTIFGPDYHVPP